MMSHRFRSSAPLDSCDETVEQYLARGGSITHCPEKPALGATTFAPTLCIDGYELPLGTGGDEYVPNYIRDVGTYDTAQTERVTVEDDASAALVRADVSRVTTYLVTPHLIATRRARREGADIMED